MLNATCGILFTALLFMKDEAPPVQEEAVARQDQFVHLRDGDSYKGTTPVKEGSRIRRMKHIYYFVNEL